MIDLTKLAKTDAGAVDDDPSRRSGRSSRGRHKHSVMGMTSVGMAVIAMVLALIGVPVKNAVGLGSLIIFIILFALVAGLCLVGIGAGVVGVIGRRRSMLLPMLGLILNPLVGAAFGIYLWWPVPIDLAKAAVNGDVQGVERAVALGVDVDAPAEITSTAGETFVGTPLIGAAMSGKIETVTKLLDFRAAVNALDTRGRSALFHAVAQGHLDVATVLLSRDADPNLNPSGPTALYHAAAAANVAIVDKLLRHGAKVDTPPDYPLIAAAETGNTEILKLLLKNRASVNATDPEGNTALHIAAGKGYQFAVKELLAGKANVALQNRFGESALERAIMAEQKVVVDALLNANAPLDIFAAVGLGDMKRVEKELEEDPKLATKAKRDLTPLHVAARIGQAEIAKLLIEKGADANARPGGEDGPTPLLLAAHYGHDKVVAVLLDAKADPNVTWQRDGVSAPPLYLAVIAGSVETVDLLVSRGADVNHIVDTPTVDGTPLLFAAIQKKPAIAQSLIKGNANVNLRKNESSPTPLVEAVRSGELEMVRLLVEGGADVNVRVGGTALLTLVETLQRGHRQPEVIDAIHTLLVNRGAER